MDDQTYSEPVAPLGEDLISEDFEGLLLNEEQMRALPQSMTFLEFTRKTLRGLRVAERLYGEPHTPGNGYPAKREFLAERVADATEGRKMRKPLPKLDGLVEPHELAALSTQQMLALQFMLEGHAIGRVARMMGLNRLTIYRWKKHCPEFKAILVRCRKAAIEETLDTMAQIGQKATRTIRNAVKAKDVRAAFNVVREIRQLSLAARRTRRSSTGAKPAAAQEPVSPAPTPSGLMQQM